MKDRDLDMVKNVYFSFRRNIDEGRKLMGRPLTYTEKVLLSHLYNKLNEKPTRLKDYINFKPDRVALQDATAQMALLQFSLTDRNSVAVPSTVHCDHLIRAHVGRNKDLLTANQENDEVYSFLKSAFKPESSISVASG